MTFTRQTDWHCDVCKKLRLHIESGPGECINALPERLTAKEMEFLDERVLYFTFERDKALQVCAACHAMLEGLRAHQIGEPLHDLSLETPRAD